MFLYYERRAPDPVHMALIICTAELVTRTVTIYTEHSFSKIHNCRKKNYGFYTLQNQILSIFKNRDEIPRNLRF